MRFDGYRERKESWAIVLGDPKHLGMRAQVVAVGGLGRRCARSGPRQLGSATG